MKKHGFPLYKAVILLITAVFMMSGCSDIAEAPPEEQSAAEQEISAYPVTVCGLNFADCPEKVCSLSPAATEMIYELGYGDRVKYRSIYCNYPPEAGLLPDVGSAVDPDLDLIASLPVQLVISQTPIANKDVSKLEDAGISFMLLPSPSSSEELYGNYEKLSLVFCGKTDYEEAARKAYEPYENAVEYANDSCVSLVLILNSINGSFSVGTGDTFAGDYISSFGRNIAESNTSYTMTAEELAAADPQVIFLANPLGAESIDEDLRNRLTAFSEGHVYVIDTTLLERPTSRLADLTIAFADTIRADCADSHTSYAVVETMAAETTAGTEVTDEADEEDDQ